MRESTLKKLAKPMIVLATLIWGSTFFILKDTLDDVDLMFLLAFRFTLAAGILALVFWRRWKGLDLGCVWRGGAMGALLFAAYAVQNYGLMDTTPGKNAFFTAVYCVIVPFLYWGVDKLPPTRWNVLAAVLCVAGIGLVSWDGGVSLTGGDLLTLCGGLLYACHIVAVSKFSQGRDIFLLTVLQFAVTAACCWAGTLFTRGLPVDGLPARAWWVLLYLAVAATALALLFQNVGQKYTDPSSAALLLALEAPFGVAFSVLFGAESPAPLMYLGFFLIFLAIVCSETQFKFLRRTVKA
ncbi:MAG: DMT family transporter [Oscillospiraceae bacterium]|jgi:drug/metabolite transporter (DMT)-like permease|nr:DMT family transporter [Oscillospiraceae bacterium]MCI9308114.1 DMT family transporter [Oscillospiraceae bacterium]MCI9548790.1 DMT family transporter [Oscillospiraceae bacterium]